MQKMFMIIFLSLLLSQFCGADVGASKNKNTTVVVGLEPFAPLITREGGGYRVDFLKAIETNTKLNFDIRIMSYRTAKRDLKIGRVQLIGHTPYTIHQRS